MKINVYSNYKDMFFEFERNKYEMDETENIVTPNTSWFLLKPSKMDPKMNRYLLSQGEIIKIGRITMRIRDIKFGDKKKKAKDSNKNTKNNAQKETCNNDDLGVKTEGGPINSNDNIYYNSNSKNKILYDLDLNTKADVNEKIIKITNKKRELKKNLSIFSKVEKKTTVCRICYNEEEDSEKDPLVQPCICDGSLKYIHLSCLRKWISTHSCIKLDSSDNCTIYLIKPVECELCKTKFPDFIKYQNKLYPLLDFTNDFKSYFTLESLTLDKNKNKFIYVVSLLKAGKIKAGRGHECDVLLSDISVSRVHCYFVVDNKKVYLEDNDSKFATLVFVQSPRIKISPEIPLFLQIGRTSLEIKVKNKFKLFSCCEISEKKSVFSYYNQNEKYIQDNMGLVVKNNETESEENDFYEKNNNSQELKNYQNTSVYVKEMDKMSDNEFLLIKHNKKNKDIKRGVFYDEDEEEDKEKKENDDDKGSKKEDENNDNNEDKGGGGANDNNNENNNNNEQDNDVINIDDSNDNNNNENENNNDNNQNNNDNGNEEENENDNLVESEEENENENENGNGSSNRRNENDSTRGEIF